MEVYKQERVLTMTVIVIDVGAPALSANGGSWVANYYFNGVLQNTVLETDGVFDITYMHDPQWTTEVAVENGTITLMRLPDFLSFTPSNRFEFGPGVPEMSTWAMVLFAIGLFMLCKRKVCIST